MVEIDGERTVITNRSCMKELDEAIDKEKQVWGWADSSYTSPS